MFRQIKNCMLVAIAVGVVMSCSAPALAQGRLSDAEEYKYRDYQDTGKTAGCIKKILENAGTRIGTAKSREFPNCKVEHKYTFTIITCWGGEVNKGESDRVSYGPSPAPLRAGVVCARWYASYDEETCTDFIEYAEPQPYVGMEPVPTVGGIATVVVEHGALEWDDENNQPLDVSLGTVYGRDVHWAKTNTLRRSEELTEALFTDTSIVWEPLDPFTLANTGIVDSYELGQLEYGDIVLFRFYSGSDNPPVPGSSDFKLVQICAGEACIPAVTEWGLMIIALLVLTAGTVVIGRRRTMAT